MNSTAKLLPKEYDVDTKQRETHVNKESTVCVEKSRN